MLILDKGFCMINKLKYPELSWQKLLAGAFCFEMLAPFASHPLDYQRAVEMFYKSKAMNVSLDDILLEAEQYLKKHNVNPDRITEELARIKSFYKDKRKYTKTKEKAWLITWEDNNNLSFSVDKVIAIISSRVASDKVATFIEQYYMANNYTLENKFFFSSKSKSNPFSVIYAKTDEGLSYTGDMKCGNNPYIHARIVKNLKYIFKNSQEQLTWDDIDFRKFGTFKR